MPTLAVASEGPLCGHVVVSVDLVRFTDFTQRCIAAHVQYGLGSKDLRPGTGEIDCSGFARTLLMYACHGVMNGMPDGSALQQEFFAGLKLKESPPADTALNDGLLRICFHLRDDRDGTAMCGSSKPVAPRRASAATAPGNATGTRSCIADTDSMNWRLMCTSSVLPTPLEQSRRKGETTMASDNFLQFPSAATGTLDFGALGLKDTIRTR